MTYLAPILTAHGTVTTQTLGTSSVTSNDGAGSGNNFARAISTDAADKSEPTSGMESSGETN